MFQEQENHNILHAQLSELVNYINRGGADKKGESSSRGPQQPSDVQIRDSAVSGSAAGYNAFSRKLKLSAVVKRSVRDKATTYRKNIQSQATVQPAAAVLKKTYFAIYSLRSRCQTFSRAYSSLKAFKAQALEESSFI
ncbi:hypothetical protein F511_34391 [Dorcoceras hygrometricum]|uniref:Uncharacterized protein n=1 Tax=Dorcoceras hygrometricum TaxID=472368 RepID=A0A2Z7BCV0_9LAMI|nr:hypothetical protein F511_34391 [Dorcoceras hygrometricum]